ncbi:MAG: hypothetical protein HN909_04160 [Phycisphaerales bacterium]|nr:hypothetical protein [Phycisphaerales bacterium]MBT7170946.1 hypothetical protein [Phycisphaerales bacterium]
MKSALYTCLIAAVLLGVGGCKKSKPPTPPTPATPATSADKVELTFEPGSPCGVTGAVLPDVVMRDLTDEQKRHLRNFIPPKGKFFVRRGVRNVAKYKTFTTNKRSSAHPSYLGDGDIDPNRWGRSLSLYEDPAPSYANDEQPHVTVDLGGEYDVEAVCVWHDYKRRTIFEGVVVQVSTRADFSTNSTETVFNNDYSGEMGFGTGKDSLYRSSTDGELIRVGIEGVGWRGRYVRVYTRGVAGDPEASPTLLEVGVYARPNPGDIDPDDLVELEFDFFNFNRDEDWKHGPWHMEGVSRPTICYPDNIKPEQQKRMRPRAWRLPLMMVRKGVRNVARGKTSTANKKRMGLGKLTVLTNGAVACDTLEQVFMLTDEAAEGHDEDEIPAVTVDLGAEYDVEAVCVWHNYRRPIIYEGVVVQVSTDKNFPDDPAKTQIIFNNDYHDDVGFGKGEDLLYCASMYGELMRAGPMGKGRKARYVRVYTYGVLNDFSSYPAFLEIGVYALPKKLDVQQARQHIVQAKAVEKQRETVQEKVAEELTVAVAAAQENAPTGMAALDVTLPKQRIDGTPQPPKGEPNMETSKPKGYTRPAFYVPTGTINLAKGKTVTVSEEPMVGEISQIVDGEAESTDETTLDLDSGPAWVVVDLGKECEIFAILMWHRHSNIYVFRDVIIEVSNDMDFLDATVLFNNDHDGSLGKGYEKGHDKQYIETYEGKLVDAKGTKGRYVRFWSNGNHYDGSNYWIEAMVFGRAVK